MKPFTKILSAAAISSLMAVTSLSVTATPARADNQNVAGILIGLGALYVVGRAIQERRDDRRSTAAAAPAPAAPVAPPQNSGQRGNGHRNQTLIAPAHCFVEGNDRVTRQYYRGYRARCMQNNVARPGSLPPQCVTRVTTDRGPRNIYAGRCLAQNGWQREAGFRP